MTDGEILDLITSDKYIEKLCARDAEAFTEMRDRCQHGLSKKQRRWLYSVAERLDIMVAPAENTFSELSPEKQAEHAELALTKLPWERPGYKKALRPPGK